MSKGKYLLVWGVPCIVGMSVLPAVRAQPPVKIAPTETTNLQQEQWRKRQEKREADQRKREAQERHTPDGMLWQFVAALNQNDMELAARSVEGEHDSLSLRKLHLLFEQSPPGPPMSIFPLLPEPPGEEFEARVAVVLQQSGPLEDDPLLRIKTTFVERLSLRRTEDGPQDGEWKIVPRPAPALPTTPADERAQAQATEAAVRAGQSEADGFLNAWARALSSPRQLLVRSAARASQQNVKHLLLGVLQLAQDYDETFAFTSDNFREKLMPYVKSEAIFLAPVLDEEQAFAYAINPAIAGKGLAQLDEPAQTVAFYEADKDGKALFRFDGKAVVGFADGHVALVAPDELDKLVWDFEPPLGRVN